MAKGLVFVAAAKALLFCTAEENFFISSIKDAQFDKNGDIDEKSVFVNFNVPKEKRKKKDMSYKTLSIFNRKQGLVRMDLVDEAYDPNNTHKFPFFKVEDRLICNIFRDVAKKEIGVDEEGRKQIRLEGHLCVTIVSDEGDGYYIQSYAFERNKPKGNSIEAIFEEESYFTKFIEYDTNNLDPSFDSLESFVDCFKWSNGSSPMGFNQIMKQEAMKVLFERECVLDILRMNVKNGSECRKVLEKANEILNLPFEEEYEKEMAEIVREKVEADPLFANGEKGTGLSALVEQAVKDNVTEPVDMTGSDSDIDEAPKGKKKLAKKPKKYEDA